MKCIIPCAGESSRMQYIPKMLININGKPLFLHVVDFWKNRVDQFIFVLRRKDTFYWEHLPENSAVVFQDEPKGLADAILRAEPYVNERFVVALGDCLYKGTFYWSEQRMGVGVWETYDLNEINKSYLVGVSPTTGLIEDVIEKPDTTVPHGNCGMGVYLLDTKVFDYIHRATFVNISGGDFTFILQEMVNDGEKISPIWFEGKYVNVGSPEDIIKAEEVLR